MSGKTLYSSEAALKVWAVMFVNNNRTPRSRAHLSLWLLAATLSRRCALSALASGVGRGRGSLQPWPAFVDTVGWADHRITGS